MTLESWLFLLLFIASIGLLAFLGWRIIDVIPALDKAEKVLNASELTARNFKAASRLIGDLGQLQGKIAQCHDEASKLNELVETIGAERIAARMQAREILGALNKTSNDLEKVTQAMQTSLGQFEKILKTHDIQLSRRVEYDVDDAGGAGMSLRSLLDSRFK